MSKKYIRIASWFGRATTEEVLKGTISTEKESNTQSGNESTIKKISEGNLIITILLEKLLTSSPNKEEVVLFLYKKNNQINLIIERDDNLDPIILQGIMFQEAEHILDSEKLVKLYGNGYLKLNGGCIDYKYSSSQYPDTFISRFRYCPENSLMRIKIRQIKSDHSLIENCDLVSKHVNFFKDLQFTDSEHKTLSENLLKELKKDFKGIYKGREDNQYSKTTSSSNSLSEWSNLQFYIEYLSRILRNEQRLVEMSIEVSETAKGLVFELSKLKPQEYPYPLNFSLENEKPQLPKLFTDKYKNEYSEIEKFFTNHLHIVRNYYSIDLLGVFLSMSPIDLPGLQYIWEPPLTLNLPANFKIEDNQNNSINLGKIFERGMEVGKVSLPISNLTEHVFITGKTGSGKTNTCRIILDKLINSNQIFVVESAKNEYAYWANDHKENVEYIVPANFNYQQIRFPLFELPIVKENGRFKTTIDISEHIGSLWNVVSSAFPLEGPLIPLLRRALNEVYSFYGWKTTGPNANYFINPGNPMFPEISDLCLILENLIDELGYTGELRSNIEAALLNRLKDLTTGIRKNIFSENINSNSISDLFYKSKSAVINLDYLTSQEDKSLILGIFLLRLRQNARLSGIRHNFLKKLIVIEEAHRIIPNISQNISIDPSIGRSKEEAVSSFNDAISEMRSYGIGFVIIDQSPSKVSIDVLRNVGTKIIHSVQEEDDRNAACSIIGEDPEMGKFMVGLERGFSLFHTRGMQRSSLVKMELNKSGEKMPTKIITDRLDDIKPDPEEMSKKLINELVIGKPILGIHNNDLDSLRRKFARNYNEYGIESMDSLLLNWNEIIIGKKAVGIDSSCSKCPLKCRIPIIAKIIANGEYDTNKYKDNVKYTALGTAKIFYKLFENWRETTNQFSQNNEYNLLNFVHELILKKYYGKRIGFSEITLEDEKNLVNGFVQCIYLHSNYNGPLSKLLNGSGKVQVSSNILIIKEIRKAGSSFSEFQKITKEGFRSIEKSLDYFVRFDLVIKTSIMIIIVILIILIVLLVLN